MLLSLPQRFSTVLTILAVLQALLGVASDVGAVGRVGGEFQVNTYTTGTQTLPSAASNASGDFVVVWSIIPGGGNYYPSIQGQRYTSGGSPIGAEFQVNTYTTGYQLPRGTAPSVAYSDNREFVVIWESSASGGSDTSYSSIQAQRYASDGTRIGAEFQVNTYTSGNQRYPAVSSSANGDFVVVWESYGSAGSDSSSYDTSIQGQRYASDGSALSTEFQVNSYTTYSQSHPSIASSSNGDFVVVWESYGSAGSDTYRTSIQAQRYASDGSPSGSEFQVNSYTSGPLQQRSSVALSANGDFVVVWESYGSAGDDDSFESIQGQRFASDGILQGTEFQVNTYTSDPQYSPTVATNSSGDFLVSWVGSSYGPGDDSSLRSIQGQRFASDGVLQGAQFQVNTYTADEQLHPSVVSNGPDGFVTVWESYGSAKDDSSGYSIQGQRFRLCDQIILDAGHGYYREQGRCSGDLTERCDIDFDCASGTCRDVKEDGTPNGLRFVGNFCFGDTSRACSAHMDCTPLADLTCGRFVSKRPLVQVAAMTSIQEDLLTLPIAQAARTALRMVATTSNIEVTRVDSFVPPFCNLKRRSCLKARADLAIRKLADALVSVHTNAGEPTVSGSEVLYCPDEFIGPLRRRGRIGDESRVLGTAVLEELETLGLRNRGLKTSGVCKENGADACNDCGLLRRTIGRVPTIIVEVAFHSNVEPVGPQVDAARLADPVFRQEAGAAIASGIVRWCGALR